LPPSDVGNKDGVVPLLPSDGAAVVTLDATGGFVNVGKLVDPCEDGNDVG
jgi:hypothetical protein